MRITAGSHRGRLLKVPPGTAVRPTTDKVRQAIFNILLAYDLPPQAAVLDVFCGSGSLGLEALSRGAGQVAFVEKNPEHIKYVRDNARALGFSDRCCFLQKAAPDIGTRPPEVTPAALVFLDPPYRMDLLTATLDRLVQGGWMAPGAVIVAEHENHAPCVWPPSCPLVDQRRYGDTQVSFARYAPAG